MMMMLTIITILFVISAARLSRLMTVQLMS
jgi:hypothetical protein